jgi:ATP-binding cassette, subfamily F, member 3
VEARHLTKHYGKKLVLKELEFMLIQGDFVAFVGRNGEGKTTLARIIVGNLDHEGICKLGHNVVIGYYAQNQADFLDPEKTVFQTIDDVATGEIRSKIRNILGSFLFTGETIDKKVKVLSGGEKARLALATLLLKPVNLLILDEPTNHLDMLSKDILKNALLKYDGTVIIVSHDRDFLQGLTDKVFEFRNQTIKTYIGDVYDFLESRKLSSLAELEAKKAAALSDAGEQASDNKLNYEKRKQQERELRKFTNAVQKIEGEIENLESKLTEYDKILADPNTHSEKKKSEEAFGIYQKLKTDLAGKLKEWEEAHLLLEEMKEQNGV